MTEKHRISLAAAETLAAQVVELLRPACTRIEIAGSIRRRKPDVGDVEILCTPRIAMEAPDLFGQATPVNKLDELVDGLLRDGILLPRLDVNGRTAIGERYKRLSIDSFPLDLFVCLPPAQWGVLMLIRTGPAEFSHRFVTSRRQGGMLPEWAQVRDGAIYHRETGIVFEAWDEAAVFRTIGVDYIEPEVRR